MDSEKVAEALRKQVEELDAYRERRIQIAGGNETDFTKELSLRMSILLDVRDCILKG